MQINGLTILRSHLNVLTLNVLHECGLVEMIAQQKRQVNVQHPQKLRALCDANIQLAILNRCFGRNFNIITPLRRIGKSYEKGIHILLLTIIVQKVIN